MGGKRLASWSAAQREIGTILEGINADPALALAAAASPLFALEALGYTIEPSVRREFEERIRFTTEQVARLHQLRKHISQLAGREVDPASPEDLHALLFDELRLPRRVGHRTYHGASALERAPQLGWTKKEDDPLEDLRSRHPVVEAILAYRALEASEPRLATREFFDAVRSGKAKVRASAIKARLHSGGKAP